MTDVHATLAEIDASGARFTASAASLTDDDLRAPSRLPGWTRGHVLAHVTRNADSCWNLLEWARTGAEIPQYPSNEARDAGIEVNSRRPAGELVAELRLSLERFALQTRTMPRAAWEAMVQARSGWGHPAWYVLKRRWRELEAHHVDLAAGYDCAAWPDTYVRWELTDTLTALHADGEPVAGRVRATDLDVDVRLGDGPEVSGPGRVLLGWLSGRGPAGEWPPPPSWPRSPSGWRT